MIVAVMATVIIYYEIMVKLSVIGLFPPITMSVLCYNLCVYTYNTSTDM